MAFQLQKLRNYFPLTRSESGPNPKFGDNFQSGSNQNSEKLVMVRIQSNPSPVQCSSLLISSHL